MKSVSWLHTADLHLGKPIENWKGSKEEYLLRKEEYRETFRKIINRIKEQSIPFLFIAGDFLEHGYVTRSLYEYVWEQLARISNTRIWIAPGNHDPYRIDSIYRKEKWPDNVHIFGTEWEEHACSKYDLTIIGKGFSDFHERERSLPKVKTKGRTIMIVHGDLLSREKKSDYFPILEQELNRLELDYVALGHVHQAYSQVLKNDRNTFVRYPGSPEALSWKETNERTVTIGKIDDEGQTIEFFPIHTRIYEQLHLQLNGLLTKEKIYHQLYDVLQNKDKEDYYLIQLTGLISPNWDLKDDLSWIQYKLNEIGFKHIYFEDHSLPDLDIEQLRKKSNVIARFIQLMEEKIKDVDPKEQEMVHLALYKGLEACVRVTTS